VRPSIVLLDAGGTLFTERETRTVTYACVLAAHGVAVEEGRLDRLRHRIHDAMPESVGGRGRYTEPWFREYMRRMLAALDAPLDPEPVRAELAAEFSRPEHFVVYGDVPDALDDLLVRGLRLGVVSNWSDRLPALLDGLSLSRYFETVTVSALVGHDKPGRGIFEHALARLEARPEQTLHVGDHPVNDLAGARAAGLDALLLDRRGDAAPGPDRIRSLEELLPRIEAA
jgi:putative hydrolase of the HAD superfamily